MNKNHMTSVRRPSRRAVMKAAVGCGAMSSMSMAGTFLNLQTARAMAESNRPTDFKALVCVFLNGGNDAYNMLAPMGNEYADYHAVRGGTSNGGIAIAEGDLHSIAGPAGRTFGLHPGCNADVTPTSSPSAGQGLAGLYRNGKLSFVANVGSLIQPTNIIQYRGQSRLPLGLFSHADLQRHWMTCLPQDRSQLKGWGGRMADLLVDCNDPESISMNLSLSGVNIFQTGSLVTPYSIGPAGATPVSNYFPNPLTTTNARYRAFSQIQNELLQSTYGNLMSRTLAQTHKLSIDSAIAFNQAVDATSLGTVFDSDALSVRMRKIAQVIGARVALGQRRQVFFVQQGGFDNHANLLTDHGNLMPILSRALSSFYAALDELGVTDKVVTFTASDFARTLSSNGQGSDHAWGANQIVMGGPLNGGTIRGDYPTSLKLPVDDQGLTINVGRGRLIPTVSVDQYYSELATWFGVQSNQLVEVLPNLNNFNGASPLNLFI